MWAWAKYDLPQTSESSSQKFSSLLEKVQTSRISFNSKETKQNIWTTLIINIVVDPNGDDHLRSVQILFNGSTRIKSNEWNVSPDGKVPTTRLMTSWRWHHDDITMMSRHYDIMTLWHDAGRRLLIVVALSLLDLDDERSEDVWNSLKMKQKMSKK